MNNLFEFYGTVHYPNQIHVYHDSSWDNLNWRVRGFHEDYGRFNNRLDACKCAREAFKTLLNLETKIIVHAFGKNNPSRYIITNVK